MKFLLQLVLTAALGALLQFVLPSWIIAVVAFAVSMLFARNGFVSFLNGFLAIALLWGIMAYRIDTETASILTHKIAALFSVGNTLLVLVMALVGGFIGGFGALSGSLFGALFRDKRKANRY